jgi:hypothetical protein
MIEVPVTTTRDKILFRVIPMLTALAILAYGVYGWITTAGGR